jgi:t-SNARE complex subunit (syntaxin)
MIQSIQKQVEAAGEDAGPVKESLEHLKKALEEIRQAREKLTKERPET